ncbi:MAG: isocitrate/isopropylmalate dehydrogenase family protein [Acidobacteria bacterium]|nr:isocitrate/isopropylmalate dehydrogenase family protein [Acidobacteriota bacterium]
MREGVKALRAVERRLEGVRFDLAGHPAGAGEFLRHGDPLPEPTFQACREADAVLLGAMGLPGVRWPDGTEMAPQLDLRERLDLYLGLRPVKLLHQEHTPLKGYRAAQIDLLMIRENTEGLFSSRLQKVPPDAAEVRDELLVSRHHSERLFRDAFEQARSRRRKVTLVDKSNVLPSMAFFRRIFDEVSQSYPDITAERVYVDAAALYLIQRPHTFDVIVTENIFGDILSDLAAGLVGGMGMAPSADIGAKHAVFQPAHGSAPDIAGQGIANPVAMILSAAMMLDWLGEADGAAMLRRAVERALADPANRTRDLGGDLSTETMGDRILSQLPA